MSILLPLLMIPGVSVEPAFSPLFLPDLRPHDVPVLVQAFGADEAQAEVCLQLVQDYIAEESAAADAARNALAAAEGAAPQHDDWSALRGAWQEVRASAGRIEDASSAAGYLRSQEVWGREELKRLMASRAASPGSPRTLLVDDWMAARASRWARLRRDVEALVPVGDVTGWPALEAAIRRQRPRFTPRLPGEAVNLPAMVRDACRGEASTAAGVAEAMAQHESEWLNAVTGRDRTLTELAPRRIDAAERGDRLAELDLIRRDAAARQAVVDANWQGYQDVVALLPPDCAEALTRTINTRVWPALFVPPSADRIAAWAIERGSVNDAEQQRLGRARTRFLSRRLLAAIKERNALKAAGTRRMTLHAEQRAMTAVFGPTALFGFTDDAADDALAEAERWSEKRAAIDLEWIAEVRRILGSDRWAEVPDDVRLPPAAVDGVFKDGDGEPLRFRVAP